MIDIKKLRDNPESVKQALRKRGYDLDVTLFSQLDSARKSLQVDVENLQAERKKLSAKFGKLKSSGEPTDELKKIVESKKTFEEYNISEIEIMTDENSNIDQIVLDLKNKIKDEGFETAALKYSISSSSNNKGSLGWISSKSLSQEIFEII